ncbi:hypothetical protein Fot_43194 [Forsythia ovata]|uniref:Uncharacterized protein n=1 Tax=Forsythia ovata TaxID=205694 RepID=A0ABD1RNB9_9LAMI
MGDLTFMQPNAVGLPPKPPDSVIIDGGHQPSSFHHTPAGLAPPKWDPIDLQNSSTAAVLIETISAPPILATNTSMNHYQWPQLVGPTLVVPQFWLLAFPATPFRPQMAD